MVVSNFIDKKDIEYIEGFAQIAGAFAIKVSPSFVQCYLHRYYSPKIGVLNTINALSNTHRAPVYTNYFNYDNTKIPITVHSVSGAGGIY